MRHARQGSKPILRTWNNGRIRLVTALFLFSVVQVCAQVTQGMREADLLALKGTPTSKVAAGSKVVYGWPDLQVVVVDGLVTKAIARNAAAEAAEADRRSQAGSDAQTNADKSPKVTEQLAKARDEFVRSETGKQLWATSYLGKQAPKLEVQEWLTDKPPPNDGKFRVIDFWATWCGPCRRAIPELNQIRHQFADRVDVIGISDESESDVRAMRDPPIEYFVGIDSLARTKNALAVTGIPHVIIVDPAGIVRWEGYPLLQGHELSPAVVQRVLDLYAR
jgi:cytochrome c biogenesis protein CcmG/thiol:disulfide interchange protein DsbE